jgi:predicted aspartyl protease
MADYDAQHFAPPAPVAIVSLGSVDRVRHVTDVRMLIDTGADVTLIPRSCAEELGLLRKTTAVFHLLGYDGARTTTEAVEARLIFLGRGYCGTFPLIDEDCGILGRNVLNTLSLVFDGPNRNWQEA